MREISIHASTREVTYWSRSFVLGECWFQSTLPRGKRQFTIYLNKYSKLISIHASAREATRCEFKMIFVLNISIHASAREATTVCDYCRVGGHISIHASAREATYLPLRERIIDVISIHASAREATFFHFPFWPSANNFNPRFREGSDILVAVRFHVLLNFNPRFREGSDSNNC